MKDKPIKAGQLYEVVPYDEPPEVTEEDWHKHKIIVIKADGSVAKTVFNPITRQYHVRGVLFWLRQVDCCTGDKFYKRIFYDNISQHTGKA